MKRIAVVAVALLATAAWAQIDDNFDSYATGPLSVVSGGVWNTWGGASTDAQVIDMGLSAPNSQFHDGVGVPDVVTYGAGSALSGAGSVATLSFDFLTHEVGGGTNPEGYQDMDTYIFVGSGNPGDLSTNYGSVIGVFIIDWAWIDDVGFSPVHLWDVAGEGGGGDYGIAELARGLVGDQWHHVELVATQAVDDMTANDPLDADGFFDVYVDTVLCTPTPLPFGLDDPMGLNALELYSFEDEQPEAPDDYHLFDNFLLTPEPASLGLLVLGAVALLRRR